MCAFVTQMNREAKALGLAKTHYVEPSGFDPANVGTPSDQVRLAETALRNTTFATIVLKARATLPVAGTVEILDGDLGEDGICTWSPRVPLLLTGTSGADTGRPGSRKVRGPVQRTRQDQGVAIPRRILIDTNILLLSPRLDSAAWRAVRWAGERGEVELFFPEVCLIEATAWFEREWATRVGRFEQELFRLSQLGIRFWNRPQPDEAILASHGAYLRERLGLAGTILPLPSVSHEVLVRRASSRRRPFNEHGSGYRDALIWENTCELARARPIVLLTQNSRDFGELPNLHNDLRADLVERGIPPEHVILEASLSKVVDSLPPAAASIRMEAERALRTPELLHQIEEELAEWFSYGEGVPYDSAPDELPAWFNDPVAEGFWELSNLAVSRAVAVDEDGYLVSGTLHGTTRVFSVLDFEDWASVSPRERDAVDEVDSADRSDVAVIVYRPALAHFEGVFTPPNGVSEFVLLDVAAER